MKPPCKGCTKREIGCRTNCEPWQRFEDEKRKIYAERKAQAEAAVEYKDYELLAKRGRWQRSNRKRKMNGR